MCANVCVHTICPVRPSRSSQERRDSLKTEESARLRREREHEDDVRQRIVDTNTKTRDELEAKQSKAQVRRRSGAVWLSRWWVVGGE